MHELDSNQIAIVSGGQMSATSKIVIGGTMIFSPVVGLGMMLGYYAN